MILNLVAVLQKWPLEFDEQNIIRFKICFQNVLVVFQFHGINVIKFLLILSVTKAVILALFLMSVISYNFRKILSANLDKSSKMLFLGPKILNQK